MKSIVFYFIVPAVLLAPFAIEPVRRWITPEKKSISEPLPLRTSPSGTGAPFSAGFSEEQPLTPADSSKTPEPATFPSENHPGNAASAQEQTSPAPTPGGNSIRQSEEERIIEDRFDFSRSDLKPSDVAPYYNPMYPPHRIAYYQFPDGEPEIFLPRGEAPPASPGRPNSGHPAGLYDPASEGDRVLRLTDPSVMERIVAERAKEPEEERSTDSSPSQSSSASSSANPQSSPSVQAPRQIRLSEYAWNPVRFQPGRTDSGTKIKLRAPIEFSLRGPDFTLDPVDEDDEEALLNLQKKVLSFGHGGSLLVEISGGGELLDGKGPDFVIYENVFAYGGGKLYQEFASVGVSMSPDPGSFRWFECRPDLGRITGCAGVVPTAKGGDAFDLASIGVKSARYILIRDVGNNANIARGTDRKGRIKEGKNQEGFDLDSLRVIHAYSKGD